MNESDEDRTRDDLEALLDSIQETPGPKPRNSTSPLQDLLQNFAVNQHNLHNHHQRQQTNVIAPIMSLAPPNQPYLPDEDLIPNLDDQAFRNPLLPPSASSCSRYGHSGFSPDTFTSSNGTGYRKDSPAWTKFSPAHDHLDLNHLSTMTSASSTSSLASSPSLASSSSLASLASLASSSSSSTLSSSASSMSTSKELVRSFYFNDPRTSASQVKQEPPNNELLRFNSSREISAAIDDIMMSFENPRSDSLLDSSEAVPSPLIPNSDLSDGEEDSNWDHAIEVLDGTDRHLDSIVQTYHSTVGQNNSKHSFSSVLREGATDIHSCIHNLVRQYSKFSSMQR